MLENPEKRSFREVVVERDDGSVGPLLEADVAALLSNYLKTFFLRRDTSSAPERAGSLPTRSDLEWIENDLARAFR